MSYFTNICIANWEETIKAPIVFTAPQMFSNDLQNLIIIKKYLIDYTYIFKHSLVVTDETYHDSIAVNGLYWFLLNYFMVFF